MSFKVLLHILNAEPVLADMDELPAPSDVLVKITNPRRMDDKELHYINEKTTMILWPIEKINFIEVLSGEGDEEIIGPIRE